MAPIQTTQAAGFIPEIWLGVALGQLRSYLTICRTILHDTDMEGGAFTVGQTLHLPKRGTLTVNDKAQGSNYTVQNPTATTVDLTLNKHKEVTIAVESRALSVSNQDIIAGYTKDAVIVLAEQVDTDLLAYAGTLTTNTAITGGAALTEANVLSSRLAMVQNKVPAGIRKYGVIAPTQTNALLAIDRLTRYDALGVSNNITNGTLGDGTVIMPGSIGRLHTFEISESQLLVLATTYKNLFYGEDALMVAFRGLEIPDQAYGVKATVMTDTESGITMRMLHWYNGAAGAHQLTLEVLYGFVANRPEHVQVVTTTA